MRRSIANLSLTHKQIIGLYMKDSSGERDEIAKGGHTEEEFRQIIAKAKSINPRLPIWAPCYLPSELDAIIFSFYNTKVLQNRGPRRPW